MEVTVKLWSNLAYHSPEAKGRFSFRKSVAEGTTVQQLVEDLKLPKEMPFTIVVNESTIESDCVLEEGDEVALFAPFSGG